MKQDLQIIIQKRKDQVNALNDAFTWLSNLCIKLGEEYNLIPHDNGDSVSFKLWKQDDLYPFVLIYYDIEKQRLSLTFDGERYFTLKSEDQLITKINNYIKKTV